MYTEEEYEDLVLEAQYTCKGVIKIAKNMYDFFCIHCFQGFKEMNALSYHRILCKCKAWNRPGHLKMYPTWGRSQRNELNKIGTKYGKCRRKMLKGKKLSAKEQLKRSASIKEEREMDKKKDVKRQTKNIVEVDRILIFGYEEDRSG